MGIEKTNKEQSMLETPQYERERNQGNNSKLVACSKCKVLITKHSMARHAKTCSGSESSDCYAIDPSIKYVNNLRITDDLKKYVLNGMREDDVVKYIKTDQWLLYYAQYMFAGKRTEPSKIVGTIKTVRSNIRQLARIYLQFSISEPVVEVKHNILDMFNHRNHECLMVALSKLSSRTSGKLKHGLKMNSYYLILNCSNFLHSYFLQLEDEQLINQLHRFISVLKANEPINFRDARNSIEKQRQKVSRKPSALPLEDDLKIIIKSLFSTISGYKNMELSRIGTTEFVSLRNAVCSRLTLLNARRGGEPSRLLLEELDEAFNDEWLNPKDVERLDPLERKLVDQIKICYQPGKGKKLVPILIPLDCIESLKLLKREDVRLKFRISKDNPFVFGTTNTAHKVQHTHLDGTHALKASIKNLELANADKITATTNRHLVSTVYASLHIQDPEERRFFYEHMGHNPDTTRDNYQCPPALMTVLKVGPRLLDMEAGICLNL